MLFHSVVTEGQLCPFVTALHLDGIKGGVEVGVREYIPAQTRTNVISLKTYTNNSTHFSYISHKGGACPKLCPRLLECSMQVARCSYKAIEDYGGRSHQIMHVYIPPSSSTDKA